MNKSQTIDRKKRIFLTLIVPLPSPTANTSPDGLYLQQRTNSSQSLKLKKTSKFIWKYSFRRTHTTFANSKSPKIKCFGRLSTNLLVDIRRCRAGAWPPDTSLFANEIEPRRSPKTNLNLISTRKSTRCYQPVFQALSFFSFRFDLSERFMFEEKKSQNQSDDHISKANSSWFVWKEEEEKNWQPERHKRREEKRENRHERTN